MVKKCVWEKKKNLNCLDYAVRHNYIKIISKILSEVSFFFLSANASQWIYRFPPCRFPSQFSALKGEI